MTTLATTEISTTSDYLDQYGRAWIRQAAQVAVVLAIVLAASWYVGLLDFRTLADGLPAILTLAREAMPPDFTNARGWVKPLLDTLAMSIAGTAVAVFLSFPLAFLAARNTSPHPAVFQIARTLLNALRSVPELIMGIIFVAAVGFGALPGVLALGLHSVGMVGKFFAEAIEHVRPILRVCSPRARVNRKDRIIMVVRTREHGGKGTLLKFRLNFACFAFEVGAQRLIAQFCKLGKIMDLLFQAVP